MGFLHTHTGSFHDHHIMVEKGMEGGRERETEREGMMQGQRTQTHRSEFTVLEKEWWGKKRDR